MHLCVQELIEKCIPCQAVGRGNPPEPMGTPPTEDTPWDTVAIDFYGPIPQTGQYLLVVTDLYSKFPEVELVNSTEAKTCIPRLDKIFATHGIPRKVKSDNGPPFNGRDFERYMNALGIEWTTSTPLWPQGNPHVERFMKPLGKVLKTAQIEGKPWKQELQRFLLAYRATPHTTTKVAPSELLFNRTIRGHLPELRSNKVVNKHDYAKTNIEKSRVINKQNYDRTHNARESGIQVGDTVICRQKKQNKLSPNFSPDLLTVIDRRFNTVVAEGKDNTITRNVSHFKKIQRSEESEDEGETELDEQTQQTPENNVRPQRDRRPVLRYGYDP